MSEQTAKPGPSFKPWGVRAILNVKPGTWPPEPIDASMAFKWQTRRIVKEKSGFEVVGAGPCEQGDGRIRTKVAMSDAPDSWGWGSTVAPYQPGEVYYVREPLVCGPDDIEACTSAAFYEADNRPVIVGRTTHYQLPWNWQYDYLPGIFMPRAAARLFIRMREVQAERLGDIEDEDIYAEGWSFPADFVLTWEDLHGEDSWAANPWVWAYSFSVESEGE